MLLGAIVGGALIAAGLIYDLNYCDACHVPVTLFAVVWAGATFVGTTAGGAIIGYALDDD